VLKALKSLLDLMGRKKVRPTEIDTDLLVGSLRRLVLCARIRNREQWTFGSAGGGGRTPGGAGRAAGRNLGRLPPGCR
jgi:hypothetical protein